MIKETSVKLELECLDCGEPGKMEIIISDIYNIQEVAGSIKIKCPECEAEEMVVSKIGKVEVLK